MLFTTDDGAGLFYEIEGDGEPLVLLNGIMMTTRSWALQLPALTSRYRVILHDFRGQLRSPSPGPWNIEQHADDLAALLDHLEIERLHVVGTSYGGEVGMIFAFTYPDRARSLTVIASTSRVNEHMRGGAAAAINAVDTERDRLFDIVARAFFSKQFAAAHPEVLEQERARLAEYGDDFFRGYASLCDAFSGLDVTDNLRGIRCPTLVVAAEHDHLKPVACSRTIAAEIPDARLEVIADAGHAVVIERPDAINATLTAFLNSLG
jgi:pimeloyl-ACP methyl ester carboxylesterase